MLLEALAEPLRVRSALHTMAVLLEADTAALAVGRRGGGLHELITTSAEAGASPTAFAVLNPYRLAVLAHSPGRLYHSHALLPAQELVNSKFYRRWLSSSPLGAGCIGYVEIDDDEICTLGFGRFGPPDSTPRFDDSAMRAVERVMPPLRQVYAARHGFDSVRAIGLAAMSHYERYSVGVVVVDVEGRVKFANPAAQHLFARDDGLLLRHGYLDVFEPLEASRLMRAIRECSVHGGDQSATTVPQLLVTHPARTLPLTLALSPCRGGCSVTEPGTSPCRRVVIMIHDPEHPVSGSRETVRNVLGLSERDAELACRLASGDSLESIAKRSGRSIAAVRSALKRIYRKTGTSRQAELVTLVLSGTSTVTR